MLKKFLNLFEKKDDLLPLKKKLADKLKETIPEDFTDIIDDQELMEDPIITCYGHVFERGTIERWIEASSTCPLTRAPLTKAKLFPADGIKVVINDYREQLNCLLDKINKIASPEQEAAFNKIIEAFADENEIFIARFEIEKQHALIEQFKNSKKLNIKNASHLKYWEEKHPLCYFGLKSVIVGRSTYNVSPIVYNVMKAADASYDTADHFHQALMNAQHKKMDCWASFWGNTAHNREMLQMNLAKPLAPG